MKSEGNWQYLWKYFRYMLLTPLLCFLVVFVYGFFLVFWESFPLSTTDGDPLNFETEIRRDVSTAEELKFLRARDQETLSYRFYDSHSSRILIFLHGSSYHGQYLHALADYLSQNSIALDSMKMTSWILLRNYVHRAIIATPCRAIDCTIS